MPIAAPQTRGGLAIGLAVFFSDIGKSFAAQWVFFVFPLAFLASNAWFMRGLVNAQPVPIDLLIFSTATITLPAALFALFIVRLVQFALIIKPPSPFKALIADIRDFCQSPRRIANGLPILVAMTIFNKAMLELKPAIPLIKPFAWDEALAAFDRSLHFGVDPWRLLQPVLGYDWVTFAINCSYNFWFLALFGLWFWFGFRPDFTALRTRFFLTYMGAWWIGGGILALYFSSAGPCYYGLLKLPDDPYAAQMAYLYGVNSRLPIWALDAQQMLWDGYTGKFRALGISAFPSMHNAMAMIFVLVGCRLHRWLGILFSINLAIIFFGSIHLAWHYAVDAYAGILIGLGVWCVMGPVVRWYHGLRLCRAWEQRLAQPV
ncbi:MAG: phosphatase PAP2 family protein [Hyphomicrobiales bacterium]